MRYAFISDIHGNLEALNAVLKDIADRNITRIICLGDIVGYGPNPVECLDRIRENPYVHDVVLGNHDQAMWDDSMLSAFNEHAQVAGQWTRAKLTEEQIEYLSELPIGGHLSETQPFLARYYHASPENPLTFAYLDAFGHDFEERRRRSLYALDDGELCFGGHTHKLAAHLLDVEGIKSFGTEIDVGMQLGPMHIKIIVNVGSVGQPRDHDNRACYVIYDTDRSHVQPVRVPYDIAAVQRKIKAAGYDCYRSLQNRLSNGA